MIRKQLVLCSYSVSLQLQLKLHQASQPNNLIQILQVHKLIFILLVMLGPSAPPTGLAVAVQQPLGGKWASFA